MKIILDAMGGDHAPKATVEGAVLAAEKYGCNIVLVGKQEEIDPILAGRCADKITVQHASEVITMEDKYSTAFRQKKDSSMTVSLNLLNSGEGDVVISAGSTGALLTAATLLNKRIKGVSGLQRTYLQFLAAIAVLLPYVLCTSGVTLHKLDGLGWVMLLIVGAVHTCLAYCLYFPALRVLPGQETAILSYIDPLLACLLSVTLLGESMTPMQLIGGALILGFTLWNEITPKSRAISESKN